MGGAGRKGLTGVTPEVSGFRHPTLRWEVLRRKPAGATY